MSCDSVKVLRSLAMSLIEGDVVASRTSYEQSSVAGLGMLVMQLSSQFEVAAEWLVEENATLRALFRKAQLLLFEAQLLADKAQPLVDKAQPLADKAQPLVDDASLAERIAAAGHGFDEGLRLSVLRSTNAVLRGLLIELHTHVEELETAAARELDLAIWAELQSSVYRRALT